MVDRHPLTSTVIASLIAVFISTPLLKADELFQKLYTFQPKVVPGSMVRGPDGAFYGTANDDNNEYTSCGGFLFKLTTTGQYQIVRHFPAPEPLGKPLVGDGTSLSANIVIGRDGTIYGSTDVGGAFGYGILFSLSPTGVYTVLYEFEDRAHARLHFQDENGDLYGVRMTPDVQDELLFRLTPDRQMSIVRRFPGLDNQQIQPGSNYYEPSTITSLIRATDGKIYGTSYWGGLHGYTGPFAAFFGTAFRIEDDNTLSVLMWGDENRANPGKLIEAPDGTFYCLCPSDASLTGGAVVRLTKEGTATTLKQFINSGEGGRPLQMVLAEDGNIYGTTGDGGILEDGSAGSGVFFKLTPQGELTVLDVLANDFVGHYSRLANGNDGYVYGISAYRWDANVSRIATSSDERATARKAAAKRPRNGFFRAKVSDELAANQLPRAKSDVRLIQSRPGVVPTSITIPVLANDRDLDKDQLSISEVSAAHHGSVAITEDGKKIVYTPGSSPKTDYFTYVCSDGRGGTAQTQVLIRRNAAGEFTAALRDPNNVSLGTVAVTMNSLGAFKAKVRIAGTAKTFRGRLGLDDSYTTTIPLADGRHAVLRFELDAAGSKTLNGTVQIGEEEPISFTAK